MSKCLTAKRLSASQKIASVAMVTVMGFSALSHAAPITLPYSTNFQITPDSNGDTYTPTQLEGQGHNSPTDLTSTGWVDETGEPTNVATVLAGGGARLNSATNALGPSGAVAYSDVYNSNLADHPAAGSNGNGVPLTPSGLLTISYGLNITQPTVGNGFTQSSGTNTSAKASFGVEVLGSDDKVLASLFTQSNPAHAGEIDAVVNESQGNAKTDPTLIGPANGTTATYSIALNFNTQTFTVFINGTQGGTYAFANSESQVGAIAFATDNAGTDQATFSNFSVVPEPASLAIIGLGSVLLIARRPKRLV